MFVIQLLIGLFFFTDINFVVAQEKEIRVAILPFQNKSVVDREKLEPLTQGLQNMLIIELSKIHFIKPIDRRRLQTITSDIKVDELDMIDKTTSQSFGTLLGAEIIVFGGFSNLFGDKIRIDLTIVNSETGDILEVDGETGDCNEFLTIVQILAKKIAHQLNVKLTSEDNERLQSAKDGTFESYLIYSEAVVLEDKGFMLERQNEYFDAIGAYEEAKVLYQKAGSAVNGYEPAQRKVEEMTTLIDKIKKTIH